MTKWARPALIAFAAASHLLLLTSHANAALSHAAEPPLQMPPLHIDNVKGEAVDDAGAVSTLDSSGARRGLGADYMTEAGRDRDRDSAGSMWAANTRTIKKPGNGANGSRSAKAGAETNQNTALGADGKDGAGAEDGRDADGGRGRDGDGAAEEEGGANAHDDLVYSKQGAPKPRTAVGGVINTLMIFFTAIAFGGNAAFLYHVFWHQESITYSLAAPKAFLPFNNFGMGPLNDWSISDSANTSPSGSGRALLDKDKV